jgi:RecA-family ATPase
LIEGILHQGLKAELAGGSKAMKSWLALNIAVCVATGHPWLEKFPTTKSRVLYLNLEVPRWNFHQRVRQVSEALGVKLGPDMFMIWNLRGYDLSRDDVWLEALQRMIAVGQLGLILPDPLYKLFNEMRGENETTGATAIMKRFDVSKPSQRSCRATMRPIRF